MSSDPKSTSLALIHDLGLFWFLKALSKRDDDDVKKNRDKSFMVLCNIVEYLKLYCPSLSDHNLCGFAGCRRRCCIVGWSQRSVWRTSQGLWSCLQWGRESPALPATPATTTVTTPPVCPAHLEPTQMAPTVNLYTPGMHCYQGIFI